MMARQFKGPDDQVWIASVGGLAGGGGSAAPGGRLPEPTREIVHLENQRGDQYFATAFDRGYLARASDEELRRYVSELLEQERKQKRGR